MRCAAYWRWSAAATLGAELGCDAQATLENAEGRVVDLQDLRAKVVVLHFIYPSCPDVCPLHAERIAEIQ